MNKTEIRYRSNLAEIEKLSAKVERAEKAYAKKRAAAEKLGVAEMTAEELCQMLAKVTDSNGFITDKKMVKANEAWFSLSMAADDLAEAKAALAKAEQRFEAVQEEIEAHRQEVANMEDLKAKALLSQMEFKEEQKEWAKDGIKLEARYYGFTPSGKGFSMERNHGHTGRSFHCWTLTIGADVIFTSGEFWRAYQVIKRS